MDRTMKTYRSPLSKLFGFDHDVPALAIAMEWVVIVGFVGFVATLAFGMSVHCLGG